METNKQSVELVRKYWFIGANTFQDDKPKILVTIWNIGVQLYAMAYYVHVMILVNGNKEEQTLLEEVTLLTFSITKNCAHTYFPMDQNAFGPTQKVIYVKYL